MTTINPTAQAWDAQAFFDAPGAIRKARHNAFKEWMATPPGPESIKAHDVYTSRDWWIDLSTRFELHPVVRHLVNAYRPHDWQQLLLEWPHVSTTDPTRLAYTRDEAAGMADRQTVTSVGKYVRRHWPSLPDHTLRDAAALFQPDQITHGTGIQFLIRGVELGPRSCMQSAYGTIPFSSVQHQQLKDWLHNPATSEEPDWSRHPYAVYEERFGWGMAIRTAADGRIMGRCLTWTDPDDASRKLFVRSYARNKDGDHCSSYTDTALEAWLKDKGYAKACRWPEGVRMAALDHPTAGGYLLPYIDGGDSESRRVSYTYTSQGSYFERQDDGELECSNTNGTACDAEDDDDEDYRYCEDCDTRVHYEHTYHVDREDDRCVCDSCINDYTMVRGSSRRWDIRSRYSEYYIPTDEAEPVHSSYRNYDRGCEDYYIDPEYVPVDLICTEDHGYAEVDDTVVCTDGEYRFPDDPDVVELEHECPDTSERYAHVDDAWESGDGKWYSDSEDWVLIDGAKYPEADCWQCHGTGDWYRDEVDYITDADLNKYHESYFDRCNADAEWGDELTAYVREPVPEPLLMQPTAATWTPHYTDALAKITDELFAVAA